jgi:hypothetical protein
MGNPGKGSAVKKPGLLMQTGQGDRIVKQAKPVFRI